MKKGLLTFIAASAFSLGANAQYYMKITHTNGSMDAYPADEILSVSFQQGEISKSTQLVTHLRDALKQAAEKKINLSALSLNAAVAAKCASLLTAETIAKMQEDAVKKVAERVKPVEENSELAKYGFKEYIVVELKDFDGCYTFKEDGTFERTDADQLEIVFPVKFEGYDAVNVKTVIKGTGNTSKLALPYLPKLKERKRAMVLTLPETFDFSMSAPNMTLFAGKVNVNFEKKTQSEYVSLLSDKWAIGGEMNATVKGFAEQGLPDDENTISFSRSFDPTSGAIAASFGFKKDGRDIIGYSTKATIPALPPTIQGLIQILPTILPTIMGLPEETSIMDLAKVSIASIIGSGQASQMIDQLLFGLLQGSSVDEATVTLMGDLSMTAKVKDIPGVIQTQREMAKVRRSGADQKTIQEYVDKLNGMVEMEAECKGLEMKLPMKLVASQVGVDYWAMPAVKFEDQNDYTPIVELFDIKTMNYLFNIADHGVQPLMTTVTSFGSMIVSFANLYLGMVQAQQAQQGQQGQ